jgi:hypothetical protein
VDVILTSHFHPRLESKPTEDGTVKPHLNTVWGLLPFNRPKLIVGMSLTSTYEMSVAPDVVMFPAIIDTGFNRTLEIDERHLKVVLKTKPPVPLMYEDMRDRYSLRRQYYNINMNIWIHCTPYTNDPRKRRRANETVYLLRKTKQVRVLMATEHDPWPPLPLLGLEAFTANHIHISIHSKTAQYILHG